MKKVYLYTIGGFIAIAAFINTCLNNPTFDNLLDQAAFEMRSNQPELADKTFQFILEKDSLNIDNHYSYIGNHFDIPKKKKVGKNSYEYRDDNTIISYYKKISHSLNNSLSDIGHYGNGLLFVNDKNYKAALGEFNLVKNRNLKYLNNSTGNCYNHLDSIERAEKFFHKEIDLKGNLDGAYSHLISLLFKEGRKDELRQLLKDKAINQYFPPKIERAIYFEDVQPLKYAYSLFGNTFNQVNIWGFIAACMILGGWIMYLKRIDIYEPEKWKNIIITVGMGMLFCFLTFPLSDFNNLIFGFNLNGGLLNDFIYSVFGIGAIEEFVKILPLLLMLRFTMAIDEPFDYILYASLSALGFSFVENLIYFDEGSLHIISGRALLSVASHMFDSSIIGYGMMLNKYKFKRNPYLNFLLFYLLAAIAHGFYDFWLINDTANSLNILTILFFLSSMYVWNSFKNNALSNSNFYDKDKKIDTEKLENLLFYSLSGVLAFEYFALAMNFSPSVANKGLWESFTSGAYLLFFLTGNLSKVKIIKGQWAPIKFWETEKATIDYDNIIDVDFKISKITNNPLSSQLLPNKGTIKKRIQVSNEPDWYVVNLETPKTLSYYLGDKVLITSKDDEHPIEKTHPTVVALFLIPTNTNLEASDLKRTDFKFCGWANVE